MKRRETHTITYHITEEEIEIAIIKWLEDQDPPVYCDNINLYTDKSALAILKIDEQ